jgi:hypothetical protein
VESVEELDFVELEDQFPQDLLAQERGFLPTIEKYDSEELVGFLGGDLRHEELEVVDVEFAVQQLLLTRRILPP